MRFFRGLITLLIIGGLGLFLLGSDQSPLSGQQRAAIQIELKQTYKTFSQRLNRLGDALLTGSAYDAKTTTKTPTVKATNNAPAVETPIESIVQGIHLKRTYYYRFSADSTPETVAAFQDAVSVYNATGIVHLVSGTAAHGQNQVTFGVYHKKMPTNNSAIELGTGGPVIYHSWPSGLTYNRAVARLNITYPRAIKNSVAIHELGHALGLDHSSSTASIMYPLDQGHNTLASADVRALKDIYQTK